MKKKISFVIIPPEKVQKQISLFCESLQNNSKVKKYPLSFTKSEYFYLPLTYLGAVQDPALNAALAKGKITSEQNLPFELKIVNISYFYTAKTKQGSTIFLNVRDKEKKLKSLHKSLSENLSAAEFSPSKHFTGYIEIANLERLRENSDKKKILAEISGIEVENIEPFLVDKIALLEIKNVDSSYPTFSIIKEFTLGATSQN